jgi:hypothetical protein
MRGTGTERLLISRSSDGRGLRTVDAGGQLQNGEHMHKAQIEQPSDEITATIDI